MILPFGKHKGVAVQDAPLSYIRWLDMQKWVRGGLRRAITEYLDARDRLRHREVLAQVGPPPFEPGRFWEGVSNG